MKLFTLNKPKNINVSPIKLIVVGKPKLPNIKMKKNVLHKGINKTNPP
jgi:hypothetical protein